MDLTKYIRDIPDFPKPGILFKDITPLLADPDAFQDAIDRITEHYRKLPVDVVAAVEAQRFPVRRPAGPDAAQTARAAAQAGQAALPYARAPL